MIFKTPDHTASQVVLYSKILLSFGKSNPGNITCKRPAYARSMSIIHGCNSSLYSQGTSRILLLLLLQAFYSVRFMEMKESGHYQNSNPFQLWGNIVRTKHHWESWSWKTKRMRNDDLSLANAHGDRTNHDCNWSHRFNNLALFFPR